MAKVAVNVLPVSENNGFFSRSFWTNGFGSDGYWTSATTIGDKRELNPPTTIQAVGPVQGLTKFSHPNINDATLVALDTEF